MYPAIWIPPLKGRIFGWNWWILKRKLSLRWRNTQGEVYLLALSWLWWFCWLISHSSGVSLGIFKYSETSLFKWSPLLNGYKSSSKLMNTRLMHQSFELPLPPTLTLTLTSSPPPPNPNANPSNYQVAWKVTTDKLNMNPPLSREEVCLIFRWLEVVCSLPPLDDFEPSENQSTKKWKGVFTPPPRETQAGEYEVIIPALPWPYRGGIA